MTTFCALDLRHRLACVAGAQPGPGGGPAGPAGQSGQPGSWARQPGSPAPGDHFSKPVQKINIEATSWHISEIAFLRVASF